MADNDEILARLEALENKGKITVDDLPLTDLMRALEQKWRPNASFLEPYSITTDQLDKRLGITIPEE
jgi:hypothetical protein